MNKSINCLVIGLKNNCTVHLKAENRGTQKDLEKKPPKITAVMSQTVLGGSEKPALQIFPMRE